MSVKFCKFKFTQKTTPKKFFRYKIINNNPYNNKQNFKGFSVRYQVINYRENKEKGKMFIYVLNNEYLITYRKIPVIPNLQDNLRLELIKEDEIFPITEETLDLYRNWIKYFVYDKIVRYCNKNKGTYDYRIDNKYSLSLDTPKNKLNIGIKRVFNVDTEVLLDGTAYLSVDIKCEYESKSNIYDLIKQNINVIGKQVKCSWSSINKTYIIKEVHNLSIRDDIGGFNLLNYWSSKRRVENIDYNAPIISAYDASKECDSYYIPQSLFPVITHEEIKIHDKSLSKKVDKYTKLSMGERLKIIKSFLQDLNYNGTIIDLTPVSVEELGYNYYNINRDMPNLLIANNRIIHFDEKYKVFQEGFYKLPEKPIIAAFMSYDSKAQESYDIVKAIQNYTKGKVNNVKNKWVNSKLLPLKFYKESFHYEKGDDLSYREKAYDIKEAQDVNFVISVLPIDADEEEFYNDSVVSPYDSFKHIFAELNIPSQMLSLNMVRDLGTKNITYRLQNIILGILSKSGGVPWILEKPLDNIDCFIGLDVGTQEKGIHYPACSVCLNGQGNFIGYYSTNIAQSGEKIDTNSLEKIFNNIMMSYKQIYGRFPRHIVVHRDGFSNEENDWYIKYFGNKNIEFDIIEIRKNIDIRLLEENQVSNDMNPSSGSAVIKDNTAYIVTTDVKPFLGAPRPLLVVHRYGSLSIENIVRQIYILSKLHIGSMRTSRLPLTTLYADKICKHHNHIPHNIFTNKLYFL